MTDYTLERHQAVEAANRRELDVVQIYYPYFVGRISEGPSSAPESSNWIKTRGIDQIFVEMRHYRDRVVVTHAFRYEQDAIAFRMRFPCE